MELAKLHVPTGFGAEWRRLVDVGLAVVVADELGGDNVVENGCDYRATGFYPLYGATRIATSQLKAYA